jgi:hypothetical protein
MAAVTESVLFHDGSQRPLHGLAATVAYDVFQTPRHVEVCRAIATERKWDGDTFRVGVNWLVHRCERPKNLSALLWHAQQGTVKEARCGREAGAVLRALGCAAAVTELAITEPTLVPVRQRVIFALKVAWHRVYRLFSRRIRTPGVIRAWVEVSEKLFVDKCPTSTILLYPFILNLKRHLLFTRRVRKLYPHVTFAGVPYRPRDAFRVLFANDPAGAMADAEALAFRRHARELRADGVTQIYTSDEYEPAGVALHEEGRRLGMRSVNAAHGLGVFCPYLAHDEFRYLNPSQARFYARYSPGIEFRPRPLEIKRLFEGTAGRFEPTVVFLYQNFRDYRIWYEARIQDGLVERAREAASAAGLPLVIKAHPNQKQAESDAMAKRFGVRVVRLFPELAGTSPIFLNIHSTAWYDALATGPVLTFKTGSLTPEVYYGDDVSVVAPNELGSVFARLRERSAWESHLARQREQGIALESAAASR